jgi:hypothetical protein
MSTESKKEPLGDDGQREQDGASANNGLVAELKRYVEKTRLPADVKEQVVAELPSVEEQERLYRQLQENSGLSIEQFLESLGLEPETNQ